MILNRTYVLKSSKKIAQYAFDATSAPFLFGKATLDSWKGFCIHSVLGLACQILCHLLVLSLIEWKPFRKA